MTARSSLAVLIDGVALPDDEARAFWERFSSWMEQNRGDLAGFAAQEGVSSVHPGVEHGRPVLWVSRKEAQRPYGVARITEKSGGSGGRHESPRGDRSRGQNPKKTRRKRV